MIPHKGHERAVGELQGAELVEQHTHVAVGEADRTIVGAPEDAGL